MSKETKKVSNHVYRFQHTAAGPQSVERDEEIDLSRSKRDLLAGTAYLRQTTLILSAASSSVITPSLALMCHGAISVRYLSVGFRVQGSGFRVQGSGFRVQGSGFRVQGLGFRG